MNYKTYLERKNALTAQFHIDDNNLIREYALANSSVKIGDIILSETKRIKVDMIYTQVTGMLIPECLYDGFRMTNSGSFYKSGIRSSIKQQDVRKVININENQEII